MNCIATSNIVILVNDTNTNYFKLTRGIRQGDPISPYISILCMEMLFRHINHKVDCANWDPIKINSKGHAISHILFANDLTLMARVNDKTCTTISNSLTNFCKLLGQKINSLNSKIIFSKTFPQTHQ